MKTLYEFTVKDNKDKDVRFRITKPSRRQVEEAEMEFAVELSRCVKRGIVTKTMLAKQYADTGGIMSEEQASRLMKLYRDIGEKSNEHTRISSLQRKTKKNKEKAAALEEEIAMIKREIVDIETSNISLFNQTAETKAQNKIVIWYALNLVQQMEDDEWVPFFVGNSYEEKLDHFYQKEDEDEPDELYFSAMERVLSVLALWFFNQGQEQKDFDDLLKELSGEESEEDDQPQDREE